MSPTQRSLNLMRDSGCSLVETCERWNPFAKRRNDLFGFVDVLAVQGDLVIAVQTTTASNMAARLEKIRFLPSVVHWLRSPSRKLVIHGWAKTGKAGTRKRWTFRVIEVVLDETGKVTAA